MALTTATEWKNMTFKLLWYIEEVTGRSVGDYNQDGSVRVSPFVFDILRYGYTLTSTSNYPSGQSSEESTAQADITTMVTEYLAYKIARQGLDTDNSGATLFH